MRSLRGMHSKFIREAANEGDDPGSAYSETMPLDDIAFADERQPSVPEEEDNSHEKELYKAILDHFEHVNLLNKTYADELQGYLRDGLYSDIFFPPRVHTLYRGMLVHEDYLSRALRMADDEEIPLGGGQSDASFTFTPRAGATSWTTDVGVADGFTQEPSTHEPPPVGRQFRVMLEADAAANPNKFVQCEGGLYTVDGLDAYQYESEVIGLGPIKVRKVYWYDENDPRKFE